MNITQAQKDFEAQFKAALTAIAFPTESIYPEFNQHVCQALKTKSAHGLKCEADTYQEIVSEATEETTNGWNLFVIASALNSINESSPEQMEMNIIEYAKVISANTKMMELWHSLVNPIQAELVEKNTPKPHVNKNGKKIIPINGKSRPNA